MARRHGQAESAPGCGTSSAGLYRVARANPAELTGRRRQIGGGVRYCSPFPAQPGHQGPAAGWVASIAAALRYRPCWSPRALPPRMLRSWRSRLARRVGPEMPHARRGGGRAAKPPDGAEKARRERRACPARHDTRDGIQNAQLRSTAKDDGCRRDAAQSSGYLKPSADHAW
jgi:hypothetical protein